MPVFVDYESNVCSSLPRPLQVVVEFSRNWNVSLPFVGTAIVYGIEVQPVGVEIDLRPPQCQNSLLAMTGVQAQQNENWQMQAHPRFVQRRSKKPCSLASCKPSVAGLWFLGEHYVDGSCQSAFSMSVIYCGPEDSKFSTGCPSGS